MADTIRNPFAAQKPTRRNPAPGARRCEARADRHVTRQLASRVAARLLDADELEVAA